MERNPGFRSAPHGAVRSPSVTVGSRVLPVGIYLIIPPFSKYFYCKSYEKWKHDLSDVFAFFTQLVNIGKNFENVKIYGFDDCFFTTKLRN